MQAEGLKCSVPVGRQTTVALPCLTHAQLALFYFPDHSKKKKHKKERKEKWHHKERRGRHSGGSDSTSDSTSESDSG